MVLVLMRVILENLSGIVWMLAFSGDRVWTFRIWGRSLAIPMIHLLTTITIVGAPHRDGLDLSRLLLYTMVSIVPYVVICDID